MACERAFLWRTDAIAAFTTVRYTTTESWATSSSGDTDYATATVASEDFQYVADNYGADGYVEEKEPPNHPDDYDCTIGWEELVWVLADVWAVSKWVTEARARAPPEPGLFLFSLEVV